MAITNFIPTVWSETLYAKLNEKYVAASNCNRSFEGDIKEMGSVVKICGIENVGLNDYHKDTDLSAPQVLTDTVIEFPIDQAVCFNFQIDDIDLAQASPKLMEAAMSTAAAALANQADRFIYSLHKDTETRICLNEPTPEVLLDTFITAMQKLYEAGVTDPSDVVIELTPYVASILLRAKIEFTSSNNSVLENGQFGTLFGAKVFVSNNVESFQETDDILHNCLVRTKRSIAFAEQLSEIEAYRPEKRFADAVKGLHLYGAKVVYPAEMVALVLTVA